MSRPLPETDPTAADRRSEAHALLVRLSALEEGDPRREEVRRRLVELHAPVVRRIARRYSGRGEPEEDLRQVACVGLMQAIRDFDPRRGKEFLAYALPMMTGEVKRHFRDRTWAVRVPRRLKELRSRLIVLEGEFAQRHGRAPTVADVAEELGLGAAEARELVAASAAYSALSLDLPCGAEGEERTLGETLGGSDPGLEAAEDRAALAPLLERLSPRDRSIVLQRFAGDRTQAQIAASVGLSQMHVSRLLSTSLTRMRRCAEEG